MSTAAKARPTRQTSFALKPFDPVLAPIVAKWVRSESELFMLAPGTHAPLTPAKVVGWTASRGTGYLMFRVGDALPCGYGEINRMTYDPKQCWLGHLLIDPTRRGQGLGVRLTTLLAKRARRDLGATKLSLVVFPENAAAVACYTRCGFIAAGAEFHIFKRLPHRWRMIRFEMTFDRSPRGDACASRNSRGPTS
jgi:ribosomal protein S18 acetylase RimI-like enzyme